MKFFNREEEIKEILAILDGEPEIIYFIFGPINSGKTALINEIINNRLDKSKYVIFYFNLRDIFLSKYEDFVEVLFEEYSEDKKPLEIIKGLIKDIPVVSGIPIPNNTLNELLNKKTTKNVFKYITNILLELKNQGKQPVIIIDELQKIGDMKINGYLIYELFNYFISLTKHKHLCHVFCLSSDSLFIEMVYNEAMLKDRADYILVDDFDKETAMRFIEFLSKEKLNKKLSNDKKELIYSYVGGKPILIKMVINKLKYKELKEILDTMLDVESSKLKDFLEEVREEHEELYKEVINALSLFKEQYIVDSDKIPKKIRLLLIKRNILFLNPIKRTLKPQSYLTWNAIKRVL
ncbi:ATP-binding protein [Methanocaldococcus sp. 10A]